MAGIMMIIFIYLSFMYFGTKGRNEYYVVKDRDNKYFRILKKAWYMPYVDFYVGGKFSDFETAKSIMQQYRDRS